MAARGPQNGRRVWKGVYPYVFAHSKQLLLNKFFDPSAHSMRKVDDKKKKKRKKKIMAFLVATTSLPAVYRPNGYARRRPLERRTLVQKCNAAHLNQSKVQFQFELSLARFSPSLSPPFAGHVYIYHESGDPHWPS